MASSRKTAAKKAKPEDIEDAVVIEETETAEEAKTKKQQRLDAEAALEEAKKELEESYANLRKRKDAYEELALQALKIPNFSDTIKKSEEDIVNARAKIKEYEAQIKENEKERQKTQASYDSLAADIRKKEGTLKNPNLKKETKTKYRQEVLKLKGELAILQTTLMGFDANNTTQNNQIKNQQEFIDNRESAIAEMKAKMGNEKENKALFKKLATAETALDKAKEAYAQAKDKYFNAHKLATKLQNIGWKNIAASTAIGVGTKYGAGLLIATALTPFAPVALVPFIPLATAPVVSAFSSTVLSTYNNWDRHLSVRQNLSSTFKSGATYKRAGIAAGLSLLMVGIPEILPESALNWLNNAKETALNYLGLTALSPEPAKLVDAPTDTATNEAAVIKPEAEASAEKPAIEEAGEKPDAVAEKSKTIKECPEGSAKTICDRLTTDGASENVVATADPVAGETKVERIPAAETGQPEARIVEIVKVDGDGNIIKSETTNPNPDLSETTSDQVAQEMGLPEAESKVDRLATDNNAPQTAVNLTNAANDAINANQDTLKASLEGLLNGNGKDDIDHIKAIINIVGSDYLDTDILEKMSNGDTFIGSNGASTGVLNLQKAIEVGTTPAEAFKNAFKTFSENVIFDVKGQIDDQYVAKTIKQAARAAAHNFKIA